MLKVVDRIWSRFLWLLMAGAALYVALILGAIMYQTIFRTMGWHYSPLGFVLVEYGFVYALFSRVPVAHSRAGAHLHRNLDGDVGSSGACSPIAVYRNAMRDHLLHLDVVLASTSTGTVRRPDVIR